MREELILVYSTGLFRVQNGDLADCGPQACTCGCIRFGSPIVIQMWTILRFQKNVGQPTDKATGVLRSLWWSWWSQPLIIATRQISRIEAGLAAKFDSMGTPLPTKLLGTWSLSILDKLSCQMSRPFCVLLFLSRLRWISCQAMCRVVERLLRSASVARSMLAF